MSSLYVLSSGMFNTCVSIPSKASISELSDMTMFDSCSARIYEYLTFGMISPCGSKNAISNGMSLLEPYEECHETSIVTPFFSLVFTSTIQKLSVFFENVEPGTILKFIIVCSSCSGPRISFMRFNSFPVTKKWTTFVPSQVNGSKTSTP